ncbi:isocitrate/isopropylmalate dehydrogenase family protein [Halorutilales archaeon Cl-col2-1]
MADITLGVAEGDGVGREVVPATVESLRCLDVGIETVSLDVGRSVWESEEVDTGVTEETLERIRDCDALLLGAVESPDDPKYESTVLRLRNELGLYANVRPSRTGTVVRENTEGLYSGEEISKEGACETVRSVTTEATRKTAVKAVEEAESEVTVVHKANVVGSDRLFRDVSREVIEDSYVEYDERLVDSVAHDLADGEEFDVLLTPNLYGDILSDLTAGLGDGLGVAPSANIGDDFGMFEPVHGSAPDIAGEGVANPAGCLLSASMMLDYLGFEKRSRRLEEATYEGVRRAPTPDLGGESSTEEVVEAVIDELTKDSPYI